MKENGKERMTEERNKETKVFLFTSDIRNVLIWETYEHS
jgi:hypothetical protein